MKNFQDYFCERLLIKECIRNINEAKEPIKLPYTFDIYNEGAKNVNYKITKSTIYKIFFNIGKSENYSQMIKLPLPGDKITYKEFPNKENTKDWTVVPEISEYALAGAWYSDKFKEYNYNKYNKDWNDWFAMVKPYMKGKLSVTLSETDDKDSSKFKILELQVNNEQFNKERAEKIKELKDPKNLETWAQEADAKEKAEIKKRETDEANKKKASEEWNKWWNSLSDDEKTSWSMGYGRNKYQGD